MRLHMMHEAHRTSHPGKREISRANFPRITIQKNHDFLRASVGLIMHHLIFLSSCSRGMRTVMKIKMLVCCFGIFHLTVCVFHKKLFVAVSSCNRVEVVELLQREVLYPLFVGYFLESACFPEECPFQSKTEFRKTRPRLLLLVEWHVLLGLNVTLFCFVMILIKFRISIESCPLLHLRREDLFFLNFKEHFFFLDAVTCSYAHTGTCRAWVTLAKLFSERISSKKCC
jgi:hypothetical protein